MHSIRNTPQRDACFPNELEGAAPQGTTSNTPRQQESRANLLEEFVSRSPMTPASLSLRPAGTRASGGTVAAPATSFLRTNGVPFPTSSDGTPRYKQGDLEAGGNWGARRLGDGASKPRSIQERGCAMTSVAMALSKLSGETITPAVLDAFLDVQNGYRGNAIVWAVAGKVTEQPISLKKSTTWNLDTINAELAAGRPVVLGVNYKDGESGGSLGTDHWVCLTRREPGPPELYFANDPANGQEIRFLRQPDGTLLEETLNAGRARQCNSTGEFVTFSKPVQS